MHLTGRIRRLLSVSSGPTSTRPSTRRSDVSEDSSISYDRSSGSFVQRVTTSLRSRTGRRRRAASEGGTHEEDSLDALSSFPEESLSSSAAVFQHATPPRRYTPHLPPIVADSAFVEPASSSSLSPNKQPPAGAAATLSDDSCTTGLEVVRKRGNFIERHPMAKRGVVEDSMLSWEDGPSPQERQKSQDLVAAWLDTAGTNTNTSSSLLEIPEDEEEQLAPVRQPLRMLDAISEDEVLPDFVGSSTISTAPSTPMLPTTLPSVTTRSSSRSPPSRRRSLEGQEEFPMRGLDTIQEATDSGPTSSSTQPRRRSLESAKRPPLESIPEVESTMGTTTPRRRRVLKGFGLQRSESEPVIAQSRQQQQQSQSRFPPILSLSTTSPFVTSQTKPTSSGSGSAPRSPSLPTFQRDIPALMGQRSKSAPGPQTLLNPTIHTQGSIALQTSIIEDDESRRLTEVAYLM